MISECPFQNASVPELIIEIKGGIDKYAANKNPELLREIKICLEQARLMLRRSLVKADSHDKKRIEKIGKLQKELDGLEMSISRH
jgi:predicted translin family RNA/ssDNA-binding protein